MSPKQKYDESRTPLNDVQISLYIIIIIIIINYKFKEINDNVIKISVVCKYTKCIGIFL